MQKNINIKKMNIKINYIDVIYSTKSIMQYVLLHAK